MFDKSNITWINISCIPFSKVLSNLNETNNFVTRGKQSDFGMCFVCMGMIFYLSSSSRIIQKDMFRFPVSELRLRCWKKMALNPSSSGMQKVHH